jgi:hypothetical protein
MDSVNNETNNNLKNLITENNYLLDYKNFYLTRMIKFLINFILTYAFLEFVFNPEYELTRGQLILLICAFTSILIYVLDSNYPSCFISLK